MLHVYLWSQQACAHTYKQANIQTPIHTHTQQKGNIILEKMVRLILWKNFMCIFMHLSENSVEIRCKLRKYLPRGHSRNQLYIHVYVYSKYISTHDSKYPPYKVFFSLNLGYLWYQHCFFSFFFLTNSNTWIKPRKKPANGCCRKSFNQ